MQPPPTTWRSVGSDLDRAEEARKAASKTSPSQSFGETVKRHLDRFDLETSLNEIAEGSGRALSFSRDYGEKAHNTQRAGLSSESMPTLTECDEMLKRQRGVLDSIQRIRDVILKQQQDLAEQQRSRTQVFKAANDYDDDSLYGEKLDGAGGLQEPMPRREKDERLHLAGATAATEQKHQNGDEGPMVPELSAMPVDFTMLS
ncbi:hypothetical protein G7Y79_00001g000820 [Physcia stellaris]|nr:hypothetical protein G7Y79_00001g000820 [Physcia stellaris]